MILETLAVLGGGYTIYNAITVDKRKERAFKREIITKWDKLMTSLGNKVNNKLEQSYKIGDIFVKEYGFNCIVCLPYGLSCNDFRHLIPLLQQCYNGEVIAEPSNNKDYVYVRVHINGYPINEKDHIKFVWYKFFNNRYRNDYGETYKIDGVKPIISPNKDIVGYKLSASIPNQLSYNDLVDCANDLSKLLNKCFIEFNNDNMKAECTVITNPIENNTLFAPIKVKPYQLYVGMGYDYKPIIFDYSLSPNGLIAGTVNSGKTVSLIMAFINLCCCRNDFELYIGMMSEKEDLRIFKDVEQCKEYCNSPSETISLLRKLNQEMDRRNKLFASMDTYCSNIYKYNELSKKKLKIIHFISDEIADLMEHNETQPLLWNLIRKGRSSGIYITLATQRASKENLSPEIKAQLSNKVCFNMTNSASALTVLSGEGLASRAVALEKQRELIADYNGGVKIGKTLFLSEDMMVNFLKNCKKSLKIDEKHSKNDKKDVKNTKNQQKFKNINKK